jgi:hypothetical protein
VFVMREGKFFRTPDLPSLGRPAIEDPHPTGGGPNSARGAALAEAVARLRRHRRNRRSGRGHFHEFPAGRSGLTPIHVDTADAREGDAALAIGGGGVAVVVDSAGAALQPDEYSHALVERCCALGDLGVQHASRGISARVVESKIGLDRRSIPASVGAHQIG